MKKLISSTLALVLLATALLPSMALAQHGRRFARGPRGCPPPAPYVMHSGHSHHHSGWYVAGGLLTGLALGSLMQNVYAEPPRREVVYTTTTYVAPPPPIIQEVQVVHTTVSVPDARVTIWVRNSNGSQTPVELRRASGGRYIGPRGEYYDGLPGNEQLLELYGL